MLLNTLKDILIEQICLQMNYHMLETFKEEVLKNSNLNNNFLNSIHLKFPIYNHFAKMIVDLKKCKSYNQFFIFIRTHRTALSNYYMSIDISDRLKDNCMMVVHTCDILCTHIMPDWKYKYSCFAVVKRGKRYFIEYSKHNRGSCPYMKRSN